MTDVNRVTPDMIEGYVVQEQYFTAWEGLVGARDAGYRESVETSIAGDYQGYSPLKLLTFCVLVLRNGYTVVGTSACADPKNYDREIGKTVARAKALEQIWPLMGYALRNKLAGVDGLL